MRHAILALTLIACSSEGPQGPVGPAGPQGPPGSSAAAPAPATGRLRVVWTRVRSTGLDAVVGGSRIVDTARGDETCAPGLADDGVERCLPATVWEEGRWWVDSSCSASYAHGVGKRDGKTVYVRRPGTKGARILDTVQTDPPRTVYVQSGASCVEVPAPTHVDLLRVGTEVGATSFAEAGTSGE